MVVKLSGVDFHDRVIFLLHALRAENLEASLDMENPRWLAYC